MSAHPIKWHEECLANSLSTEKNIEEEIDRLLERYRQVYNL